MSQTNIVRRQYARLSKVRCKRQRRGAAVVEFAVVAPVLFALLFGMVEFGRMVMVQQTLTNASREGARRGILENASQDEVEQVVLNYLSTSSITGATVDISPSDLNTIGFGDPVTVNVSVDFQDVSWLGSPWFLAGKSLTGSSSMLGERLE